MSGEERALIVDDIHTYYGDSHVLHGVSLRVPAGALLTVIGRNGVGKSTLMRSISGLTPPRRGRISFGGRELVGLRPHRIARLGVGLVPQGRRIFASLTVKEHLTRVVGPFGREVVWSEERLVEMFPQLGVRWNQRAGHLSGGEQSMLAIARALRLQPTCLLMDEPMEGLAPVHVQTVAGVIQRLRTDAGLSILLVVPDLALALRLADRICVMSTGRIVFEGGPDELAERTDVQARHIGVGR